MIGSSCCELCKHYIPPRTRSDEPTCAAFPDEIPFVIFMNKHDHRAAYPGDNGVRFEPKDDEIAAKFVLTPESDVEPYVVAEEAAYLNPGMKIYEPQSESERAVLRRAAESHLRQVRDRKRS